ncbi:MAG: tetratricopeptide repeat protein [Proteobacteria bacterium]|nr:tetratricopeptide repeat protein [Pseudomonadota bacterium]MDA1357271.1 tetratricopeptide repeat protein [Pseudomonadota bacterium]
MISSRFAAVFAAATLVFSCSAFAASNNLESALNSSASLYAQGRFQEAIPHAKEALAIAGREMSVEDVAYAEVLDNLAALYEAELDYTEARPLYRRALDIRLQKYGPKHPEVVNSLINLALIYDALGDYSAAQKLDARATVIIEASNRRD